MPQEQEWMRAAMMRRASAPALRVPPRFTDFCMWLGVELEPGQYVIARVAYDGAELEDLEPVARPLARAIFGDVGKIPVGARGIFTAVCGGRGGKSYVLIALRLVHGMFVRDLRSLAPGQRAVALIVAPNDELRQEVVNYAVGAIRSHPELRKTLIVGKGKREDDAVSEFDVRRPDGRIVSFRAGVATRGGYGGRGKSLTDFALDESAFFRDASYQVNDADIFKAASPRVLPGGQSIIGSTPWAESGLLYDIFARNWGKPSDAMVAHAPTLTLRDTPHTRVLVEREMVRDPDNAAREFGAQFLKGGTVDFFEPASINAAIREELPLMRTPKAGEIVAAGGDFGFRSDSSALAVVHLVGQRRILGELLELRPEGGLPLRPSVTVTRFADRMAHHGVKYVMADRHYQESISEHLSDRDLAYAPAPAQPADAYVRARMLFRQRLIELPNHPRLIQQLKEVKGRPLPGGGMSILHPRWRTGGHGDLAAAFVLALYQLGGDTVEKQAPPPGTDEWEERAREKRRAEVREKQAEGAWWKR